MMFAESGALTRAWKTEGRIITIETAGTICREVECDLLSVSPKLSNSCPDDPIWAVRHEKTRADLDPLRRLMERYTCQLKFVVNPETGKDIDEILELLRRLPPIAPERILLMPEGIDADLLNRRMRLMVATCKLHGWRLCPRLHIHVFGNQRGT
jgi:7-carboxy-7-deazaguanine synthase